MADQHQDQLNLDAPEASAPEPPAAEEKAPKRRGRPRKVKTEDAGAEAPKKPATKRTTRKRKTVAADAPAPAPISDEVAAARALAQVSQAAVARRERAQAEKAEERVAGGTGEDGDTPAPAPKKRATRRPRVKKTAVDAETVPAQSAPDVPDAGTSAASDASSTAEGAAASEVSPRPRRTRSRAKKAAAAEHADEQVEQHAEKQASAQGKGEHATADASSEPSEGVVSDSAIDAKTDVIDAEGKDVRPGRSRRAKQDEAAASDGADASSKKNDAEAASAGENEGAGAPKRRKHERRDRNDRGDHNDRNSDRGDRNNDRRNNRRDRKQRNNRFNAPVEPSLSREELAGMKVAELREKGRELDLDVTGKKKAELVEEIYTTAARIEGFRDIEGMLEIQKDGHGYIRAHGYMSSPDDAFVPANLIRGARLRPGDMIAGTLRPSRGNDKFPALTKIKTINGMDPEESRRRPKFSELTPVYPNELLRMEHGKESITGRAIDIVSPIGKGQRGLIVSPPKAGKTTILKKICQSIAINNPEVKLICLLVDERPEEVTDMQRSIKGDVVASTFDMPADNHTRVSELVIERAKRIVELGGDVVVVLDSITRLARAYNLAAPASGRILSGGVDSAALYPPKKFLGAARNIENGGSLTILASALVDTGSKMDEVIFEEFKGTGNMELKLDRDLADRRIFPAIDPVASGTRNENLLIDDAMRPFVWGLRDILASMNNTERAAAAFIKGLKNTDTNQEFLIRSAKRHAVHESQY